MKEEIKEKLETAAVVVFSPVLALANGAVTAIRRSTGNISKNRWGSLSKSMDTE